MEIDKHLDGEGQRQELEVRRNESSQQLRHNYNDKEAQGLQASPSQQRIRDKKSTKNSSIGSHQDRMPSTLDNQAFIRASYDRDSGHERPNYGSPAQPKHFRSEIVTRRKSGAHHSKSARNLPQS